MGNPGAVEFTYSIPLIGGGTKDLSFTSGSSALFVGANGSGKSRLGSYLELRTQHTDKTHRVGAQRALQIPSHVPMADRTRAQHALLYGHDTSKNKERARWQQKRTTILLSDYERLLVALFSEEFEIAMDHKRERELRPDAAWPETRLATVKEIWDNTILTRELLYKGVSLYVTVPGQQVEYPSDE